MQIICNAIRARYFLALIVFIFVLYEEKTIHHYYIYCIYVSTPKNHSLFLNTVKVPCVLSAHIVFVLFILRTVCSYYVFPSALLHTFLLISLLVLYPYHHPPSIHNLLSHCKRVAWARRISLLPNVVQTSPSPLFHILVSSSINHISSLKTMALSGLLQNGVIFVLLMLVLCFFHVSPSALLHTLLLVLLAHRLCFLLILLIQVLFFLLLLFVDYYLLLLC